MSICIYLLYCQITVIRVVLMYSMCKTVRYPQTNIMCVGYNALFAHDMYDIHMIITFINAWSSPSKYYLSLLSQYNLFMFFIDLLL